jgi:hypothetical protein
MSKPLLQEHKNEHTVGHKNDHMTKCLISDNITDTDEDDVKKKIKQMILTKDLFSIIKVSNNEINTPSSNLVKIGYNLPSNHINGKLFYDDNSIFYQDFLTKLKEENKNESRRRSKKNSNNVNSKIILREDLKELNNHESNVVNHKKGPPEYLFSKEKEKRVIDLENNHFAIKINKEDDDKERNCQVKENVKDLNVIYKKLDLKKHLHLPNDDLFNVPIKINGTFIKSSPGMSNLQLNNEHSYNFSQKSPNTENKFIKRSLKLDTTNIKLPPISKEDKKNNSNPLKNKKTVKNLFLGRVLNPKENEVEMEKEGKKIPEEINQNSGLKNSEKDEKTSKEIKEGQDNKKRFCCCFDLF